MRLFHDDVMALSFFIFLGLAFVLSGRFKLVWLEILSCDGLLVWFE